MPDNDNFSVTRSSLVVDMGSTFTRLVQVNDDAGTAFNFTPAGTWTVTGKVRPHPASSTVTMSFDPTLTIITSPLTDGQVQFGLTHVQTALTTIRDQIFFYDVEATDGSQTIKVDAGKVKFRAEVTY